MPYTLRETLYDIAALFGERYFTAGNGRLALKTAPAAGFPERTYKAPVSDFLRDDEREKLEECISNTISEVNRMIPESEFHYRLLTPLLDWTTSLDIRIWPDSGYYTFSYFLAIDGTSFVPVSRCVRYKLSDIAEGVAFVKNDIGRILDNMYEILLDSVDVRHLAARLCKQKTAQIPPANLLSFVSFFAVRNR